MFELGGRGDDAHVHQKRVEDRQDDFSVAGPAITDMVHLRCVFSWLGSPPLTISSPSPETEDLEILEETALQFGPEPLLTSGAI